MPVFSLPLGAVVLAAFAVGGDVREGVFGFAVLVGVGLLFLLGGCAARHSRASAGRGATSAGPS